MNRNVESHFSELPFANIERSMFDRSFSHKTSFNSGELIPFYIDEVLPGDTFNVTTSAVVRLQTLIYPIMDNIYLDTYYFFVPNRIVWTHWKNFMGENGDSPWEPQTVYTIPKTYYPSTGWNSGTIADYFGIPIKVDAAKNLTDNTKKVFPSSLPFRAYCAIVNEWFRDQNLQDPVNYSVGDANIQGTNGGSYITELEKGGLPFKAAKYHDYFTSCLPDPQKGNPVSITPSFNTSLPVRTNAANVTDPGSIALHVTIPNATTPSYLVGSADVLPTGANVKTNSTYGITPINLWADASDLLNVSVNDLRLAFQLQKFYEKNARAGTRYREVILEHFGVRSPDARMMIPEYLGGHRFPLNIHQVANQSESSTAELGDLGAMSNTADVHSDFTRSFTEHGFVIGVCVARYDHSYPQGLEKFWTRTEYTDYYWPVFANIGEQPVYKYEICLSEPSSSSDFTNTNVFGYQEAWADYRYKSSRVSGEMRPGISNSLAYWHLSDYYTTVPSLSSSWIMEDKSNVDRVLQVQSSTSNQIFADFYIKNICTRPMPMYSIPGLIDHH